MRWKYAHLDPEPKPEPGRSVLQARIDNWWQSFTSRAQDLDDLFSRRSSWDLPGWMHSTLKSIHPALMWEYGRGLRGGHRLVVTPETDRHLRPLVAHILSQAPPLDGWEFYGHRVPEPHDILGPTISARCRGELLLTGAAAEPGALNRVDLTFSRTRKLFGCNQNQAMRQAFVAAGTLLGEQCLDEWIGAIDVGTSFSQPVPLPALADRVDAVVLGIADSLPPQPYFERIESLEWTVLKLKPETTPDYSRRDDLCVAVLTDLELWTAGNRDPGFCSHRFSRHGETFCYVKIDGADGLAGSALQNRGEIDEAICAALIKERLGCIIGGGTGLRYSYVDLAILRPERSIPVIQSVLQQAGVPPRTWIHFFDADLQSEWVRVLAETPEPPWQP